MKVEPKIMGSVCLTAHPYGCRAEVKKQIDYVKGREKIQGPKTALIIGCSGGYGLATRIALAYGSGTQTLGVSFEKEPTDTKLASMGYYNNMAFTSFASVDGKKIETLNLDAFQNVSKTKVIEKSREFFGDCKIDLVVYSIASPVRVDPVTGELYKSVLKPINNRYIGKTLDIFTELIKPVEVEPAQNTEILSTVKVMGGEDWILWIKALLDAKILNEGAITVAYSYIGPEMTYPIYRDGTIGKAKMDLEHSVKYLTSQLESVAGHAYVSVNKALVTRASSVIPVVPLYLAILFKIMKKMGLHENCIEQEYRMLQKLFNTSGVVKDEKDRIRLDDYEMRADVQKAVLDIWKKIDQENLHEYADVAHIRTDFMNLHGFEVEGIDYCEDINPRVTF